MAYSKLNSNNKNTVSNNKNRVAIYIRVSTIHQIDKDSLPMQRQDLIAYAKLILGTDDVVIYEDAGYSGKNTDRPKYQEMMSQMRNGMFTHLLVWKIDRISRNLMDFVSMYQELKDLGVVFVSKNEQFQTDSAMGEAMLKIILVFAELERQMTSERVTATMIARAGNGQWNGGRVPYGYDYNPSTMEFTPNPEEKDVVILIHDKYEELRSLVVESRWLNNQGYRTRAGGYWNPVSLRLILRNVFYCGDYRYNVLKEGDRQKKKDPSEWVTFENHHPAIINRKQKERIINILETNLRLIKSKNIYHAPKHTHIFASLVFCGNCGKPMGAALAAKKKDWQYSKYACPTKRRVETECTGKITSDPIIGEFVFNYILNLLNAQNDFDSIHTPEELQARLLSGDTFDYISHIEESGLNDLYNVLLSGVKETIYGNDVKINTNKKKMDSDLSKLRKEKIKIERALDRLTNLYLYSEDAMSESEFIIQKAKLTDSLDEINEQIGFANSDEWQQAVSDEVFINRASQFIISQKLNNRNYINYKNLALSVEKDVLKSFVQSIIDSIIMDTGKVKQIIFKNGLSHTFVFRE